ncbi:MAG: ribosome small subunit-dependent GTPase A, partial [Bacteroidales bacterium]|nr:ribosome small subunit-dependent GTPase A [Bacteroidales bacterium]
MEGVATVVKNAGSHYELSALPAWELFPAVLRGKVRLERSGATNPVAVGDRVRYEMDGPANEEHPAVITEILPRDNYIIRRSTNLSRQSHVIAANLDQAVIVVSLLFPEIKLPFLDRILVTCEVYKIPVLIALNKVDLYREELPEMVTSFRRIYEGAGYPVLEVSARTGEGVDALRERCRGRINLFSGESGAGKSSLIKALDPALDPKIGKISAAHLQGKHTTSLYEMYRLASGGFVIDTPGLRGFGLVDLEKEEISKYFPEMLREMDNCR